MKWVRLIASFVIATSAALGLGRAHAGQPVIQTIDDAFVDDFTCQFPMDVTINGRISSVATPFGSVENAVYGLHWVNPANGRSASSLNRGPNRVIHNADGSTTIHGTGIVFNVVVPHEGVIAQWVGHAILMIPADPTQPVTLVFVGGPNDQLSAICSYMAG